MLAFLFSINKRWFLINNQIVEGCLINNHIGNLIFLLSFLIQIKHHSVYGLIVFTLIFNVFIFQVNDASFTQLIWLLVVKKNKWNLKTQSIIQINCSERKRTNPINVRSFSSCKEIFWWPVGILFKASARHLKVSFPAKLKHEEYKSSQGIKKDHSRLANCCQTLEKH